jgi:FKBP-type peptidyl-prolyl cis-trans isomerase SlyD
VTLKATIISEDKQVIHDEKEGPLTYLHGYEILPKALEDLLASKTIGDKVDIKLSAEDAYGKKNPELEFTVPKTEFDEPDHIEVGVHMHAEEDGEVHTFRVTAVEGDQVTLDGNHPLAGIGLEFTVEVIGVREAKKEEIEHGHVHDGHDHH